MREAILLSLIREAVDHVNYFRAHVLGLLSSLSQLDEALVRELHLGLSTQFSASLDLKETAFGLGQSSLQLVNSLPIRVQHDALPSLGLDLRV